MRHALRLQPHGAEGAVHVLVNVGGEGQQGLVHVEPAGHVHAAVPVHALAQLGAQVIDMDTARAHEPARIVGCRVGHAAPLAHQTEAAHQGMAPPDRSPVLLPLDVEAKLGEQAVRGVQVIKSLSASLLVQAREREPQREGLVAHGAALHPAFDAFFQVGLKGVAHGLLIRVQCLQQVLPARILVQEHVPRTSSKHSRSGTGSGPCPWNTSPRRRPWSS